MKPTVFIHTNHKQRIGALVSQHSMRRNSEHADRFDVRLIELADHMEFFGHYQGRSYLRDGVSRMWDNDDLQSFTPLRFMPPELMGYEGRAVVVDPDVFAVGDIWELLDREMQGKAVWCAYRAGHPASSVMLMDCEKLRDWKVEHDFDALFRRSREYKTWMNLGYQPEDTIGQLEPEWNDFDRLSKRTKLLHNTRRRTQPWKSGLPADFVPAEGNWRSPIAWANYLRRQIFGTYGLLGKYKPHPDKKQEALFFGLLRECLDNGFVTQTMLEKAMEHNFVRHDAMELMRQVPELPRAD